MSETDGLNFLIYGEDQKVVARCASYRDAMLVFLGRLPDNALLSESEHSSGDGVGIVVFGYTPSEGNKDRVIHCVVKRVGL